MSTPISSEKKAIVRVVIWTLSIISLLTCVNLLFIVSSVGPGISIPFPRNVASVPKVELITEEFISPVIEVDCKNLRKDQQIITKAPTTRISFKHCKNIGRVENQSNKNQGDIFPLPGQKWTSDFIFLNPGQNHLKIPANGNVYTIEITREMLKKEASKKAL